jgi:hypothetical protein
MSCLDVKTLGKYARSHSKNVGSFIKGQIWARNTAYILGTACKRCLQIDSSALATKPYLALALGLALALCAARVVDGWSN